jgi:hypothetical protein
MYIFILDLTTSSIAKIILAIGQVNNELQRMRTKRPWFGALSRHLPGRTEEDHEYHRQNNRSPGRLRRRNAIHLTSTLWRDGNLQTQGPISLFSYYLVSFVALWCQRPWNGLIPGERSCRVCEKFRNHNSVRTTMKFAARFLVWTYLLNLLKSLSC